MEIERFTAHEIVNAIKSRKVSATEVAKAAIDRATRLEPSLNAFVGLTVDSALASAASVDQKLANGQPVGRLAGVPVSVKDLIDVEGMPTLFGSRAAPTNPRLKDAPAVARIRKAGASIIGKTTTTEFGCKAGGGDSPLTGITNNAWDLSKCPGGSSAGAASSVAAGITPFALGTDGGGSVRIPAALSGLFGIKAQFGRVPVYPTSATPTLAHVGILSRSVADAALALETMSGFEPADPFSVSGAVPNWTQACVAGIEGLRIAWSPTLGYARPQPEVVRLGLRAVTLLEKAGAIVEEVDHLIDDPIDLWMSEFYAGVGSKLINAVKKTPEVLDPAVLKLLEQAIGHQTLEAYYAKVFRRYELRDHIREFFTKYDVLLSPTLPVTSLASGKNIPAGYSDRNIVSWVFYTYPFNLTGNPSASIPCGFDVNGLPVGIQAVTAMHSESNLFKVAGTMEDVLPWLDGYPSF